MSERRFATSTMRRVLSLAGWWDFCIDPADKGARRQWYKRFPRKTEPVTVPSSWNADFRHGEYMGAAWYRKSFVSPWSGPAHIRFCRVNHFCTVWLDGRPLGTHEGEFFPFAFDLNLQAGRTYQIVVRVDNRLSDESLPKEDVDWFHYGGIQGPPVIEGTGSALVENLLLLPGPGGKVSVRVTLRNRSGKAVRDTLRLYVADRCICEKPVRLKPVESRDVLLDVRVDKPKLWSMEKPHLYTARAVFADDDRLERFGFRRFGTRGNRITMNGKVIYMKGANRHDTHPDFGYAMPASLVHRDLNILKDLGANTMRSHYPPRDLLLDLCDEMGIMVFAEVPSWQYSIKQLATEPTTGKILNFANRMIRHCGNHPCVFCWSFGNESKVHNTSDNGIRLRPALTRMVKTAKKLDSTRFITYTSNPPDRGDAMDAHLDLWDLITCNVGLRWYSNTKQTADDFRAKLDHIRRHAKHKPVFIGETASAGAIPGVRNLVPMKWTEDYQYQAALETASVLKERKDISGWCVWQLFDSRARQEQFLTRPRLFNNKGILDEMRRPKLMALAARQMFRELKGKGRR